MKQNDLWKVENGFTSLRIGDVKPYVRCEKSLILRILFEDGQSHHGGFLCLNGGPGAGRAGTSFENDIGTVWRR